MKKISISAIIILSFISVSVFAQQQDIKLSLHEQNVKEFKYSKFNITENSDKFNKAELKNVLLNSEKNAKRLNISDVKNNVLPDESQKKSQLLAIGLSALLPGAGEFYAKSYIKSAIFLAVEAASWIYFAAYQSKGDSQTDKFQSYADTYWSMRKYGQWLKDGDFIGAEGINPNEENLNVLRDQIIACEQQNPFSHTLPVYKSQQYYELIGKYQTFQGGWTNLQHDPDNIPTSPYYYRTYRDPIFLAYADERQLANDYFNYAKTGIYVAILNHILSAADAAWSVAIYNKSIKMQTGFEIKRYHSPFTGSVGNLPSFKFSVSF
ncbi:MAG: hypothetical protein EHM58_19955 [Ignavibacteriae bacterium]|nr:MAG: hypothetical protein EHM58_19955 [Ignavibacteriota bacterium]